MQSGVFALPAGDVTEPIVDIDDVADVAVSALLGQIPTGRVYECTGPELLTFHDMAVDLSKAAGRTITYVPVGTREYTVAAAAAGVPAEEAKILGDLFGHIFDGHNSSLTFGIEEALGRPRAASATSRRRPQRPACGTRCSHEWRCPNSPSHRGDHDRWAHCRRVLRLAGHRYART